MAGEFNALGHVWIVNGKPVTPRTDEDVLELIRDLVCDDAANYVREMLNLPLEDLLNDVTDKDILEKGICTGECDKVQETQGHYESLLKEVDELAGEAYQKILEGYQPGGRRTRKEQFALDKVIEIHNLIRKNT